MSSNRSSRKKTSSSRKKTSSEKRKSGSEKKPKPFYTLFAERKAQRDLLHADAVTRFELQGPICYTEGAYQHTGECWNDAAYMLFMFSDGIKEITQEAILKGDLDAMAARVGDAPRAKAYLEALRSRFVRHYLNQTHTEALSSINLNAAIRAGHGPHRAQGINSYVAAVMGATACAGFGTNRPFEVSAANYKAGYDQHVMAYSLRILFNLEETVTIKTYHSLEEPQIVVPQEQPEKIAAILLGSRAVASNHATCLFTCNTVDYFFDNNIGVFQIPWRKLLTHGGLVMVTYSGVSGHWPAFYDKTKHKLLVPSVMSSRVHLINWDGDLTKTMVLGDIGYIHSTYINTATVYTVKGEHPVIKKLPSVVGRGVYRTRYLPMGDSE